MASPLQPHREADEEEPGAAVMATASPPLLLPPTSRSSPERDDDDDDEEEEELPIEQVARRSPCGRRPDTPVLTFRMWVLGMASCAVLSFLNRFFWHRKEPPLITAISAQIAVVPLGRLIMRRSPRARLFPGRPSSPQPGRPFNEGARSHHLRQRRRRHRSSHPRRHRRPRLLRQELTFFHLLLVVPTTQVPVR
ncbi:hypothetical protein ZWY2020_014087 [Hordeum vulgare]|nr:hypothetical protein ZWY2020_014087 [Hordeum vulgare]